MLNQIFLIIIFIVCLPKTQSVYQLEIPPQLYHQSHHILKNIQILYPLGHHRYLVKEPPRKQLHSQTRVRKLSEEHHLSRLHLNGSTCNIIVHSTDSAGLIRDLGLSSRSTGLELYTSQIRTSQNKIGLDRLALFGITFPQVQKLSRHQSVLWIDTIIEHNTQDLEGFSIAVLGFTGHDTHSNELRDVVKRHMNTRSIITIGDTGLDVRHCFFKGKLHSNRYTFDTKNGHKIYDHFKRLENKDKLFGYVMMDFPFGRYRLHSDFDDRPNGHGTHVAGIAAGGDRSSCKGAASNEFESSDSILMFDFADKVGSSQPWNGLIIPPVLTPLMELSYVSGSRVFSNSWGSEYSGYTSYCMEMDMFIYNFDDYVITVAGGNSGFGDRPGSIGSPGTAKNIITVGASLNSYKSFMDLNSRVFPERKNFMDMNNIKNFAKNYNENNLAGFSSRGPTSDGRIKPDIVAPGEFIRSSRAKGRDSSDMLIMRGTSQATPLVAKIVSIVRERLMEVYHMPMPSAALVKAILITTAKDLTGYVVNVYMQAKTKKAVSSVSPHKIGSMDQGFGRVNISPFINNKIKWFDRVKIYEYGAPKQYSFDVLHGGEISIGMVYSDPASIPGTHDILLNKIGLHAQVWKDRESFDNGEFPMLSMYGNGNVKGPDIVNNVKRIRMNLIHGNYVRVSVVAIGPLVCFKKKTSLENLGRFELCDTPYQEVSIVYTSNLQYSRAHTTECTEFDPPYVTKDNTVKMCDPVTSTYSHEYFLCDSNHISVNGDCMCFKHAMCDEGSARICDFSTGDLDEECTTLKLEETVQEGRLFHPRHLEAAKQKISTLAFILVVFFSVPFVYGYIKFLQRQESKLTVAEAYRIEHHRNFGKLV